MEYIAFDAHKHYTLASAARPDGRLVREQRISHGRTEAVLEHRRAVLAAAYAAHPERFVRKPPEPLTPPASVWINRPAPAVIEVQHSSRCNTKCGASVSQNH